MKPISLRSANRAHTSLKTFQGYMLRDSAPISQPIASRKPVLWIAERLAETLRCISFLSFLSCSADSFVRARCMLSTFHFLLQDLAAAQPAWFRRTMARLGRGLPRLSFVGRGFFSDIPCVFNSSYELAKPKTWDSLGENMADEDVTSFSSGLLQIAPARGRRLILLPESRAVFDGNTASRQWEHAR